MNASVALSLLYSYSRYSLCSSPIRDIIAAPSDRPTRTWWPVCWTSSTRISTGMSLRFLTRRCSLNDQVYLLCCYNNLNLFPASSLQMIFERMASHVTQLNDMQAFYTLMAIAKAKCVRVRGLTPESTPTPNMRSPRNSSVATSRAPTPLRERSESTACFSASTPP